MKDTSKTHYGQLFRGKPVQRIVRGLGETVAKDVRTLAADHWQPEKQR